MNDGVEENLLNSNGSYRMPLSSYRAVEPKIRNRAGNAAPINLRRLIGAEKAAREFRFFIPRHIVWNVPVIYCKSLFNSLLT
jgi:hypothetical protein